MSEERLEINGKYAGFISDGKKYLQRCPECNKENWAPAVATGKCAWCGFDTAELNKTKEG